jgi:molybdopterin molybdotransferase
MITYEQALDLINNIEFGMTSAMMPLNDCYDLILAEDITAPIPSPSFTNSAMDGYAVIHEEAQKGFLKILDTVFAQEQSQQVRHQKHSCIAIMTGAPVPDWADTVVPVEKTSKDGDTVSFNDLSPSGSNIRRLGEDIEEGAVLLKKGTKLIPERIMVAAAFGLDKLPVFQNPEINIFCTGDELKELGEELAPGTIYNSSQYFLRSSCAKLGLKCTAEIIGDDSISAEAKIGSSISEKPTLILTTGAVSAGEKDFIPSLATKMGFKTLMHKAAIRPGKPIFLAQKGSTIWLGLPGNAISTCVGWQFFGRPLLSSWAGLKAPIRRKVKIQNTFKKPEHLRCFYRAEINGNKAWIAPKQGSSFLAASIQSECYVELPEGQALFRTDSEVMATFI